MSIQLVIGAVVLVALITYGLGAGADFGGGMWDLLASGPRAERQRQAIEDAIGPIWEANHVWLVLAIVLVFSAFPPAFAAIMTALFIPMTLVLIGIVLRAAAFVFRKYDVHSDAVHRRWSTVFGVSSFLTPLLLGLCLGALGSGDIHWQDGHVTTGFFAGWTTPFAIGCGLFAQGLFAFLAATYLAVDTATDRDLQNDFRTRALFSGLSLAPAAALVFLLSIDGAPAIHAGLTSWWAPLLLAATSVCAVGALLALRRRAFTAARTFAVGQVALILLGWGLAQYPHLVIPDLTLTSAATAQATLRLLGLALLAGSVLLVPALWYLFRVFKGDSGSGSGSGSV
jgi:cytochrome d ubiquinol oxidase subunit II